MPTQSNESYSVILAGNLRHPENVEKVLRFDSVESYLIWQHDLDKWRRVCR